MNERTMLMELVETTESVEPDWDDALKRAGYGGRYFPRREEPFRRRRLALLVAAALVLLYIVSAVAADSPHGVVYWLFDRSPKTYPVLQEPKLGEWKSEDRAGFDFVRTDKGLVPRVRSVPVMEAEVAGEPMELQMFFRDGHLGVGINPGGTPKPYHGTDIPAAIGGAGAAGYPIYGLEPDTGPLGLHWVGWTLHVPGPIEPTGGGTGPKYMFGLAAPNVRRVALEGDHGTVVSVPAFPGPSTLGVNVRVWVAVLRLDQLVQTIVPWDENGDALEHWHLPEAQ
jgi:hypothetical protein